MVSAAEGWCGPQQEVKLNPVAWQASKRAGLVSFLGSSTGHFIVYAASNGSHHELQWLISLLTVLGIPALLGFLVYVAVAKAN